MEGKENKILIALVIGLMLLSVAPAFAAPTVVKELFHKEYTVDLSTVSYKSCKITANYESGVCDYLYLCYVVLPKGSTELYQVYQKECTEVTGQTTAKINVSIVPPRGKIYAVSVFVAQVHYTYDNVNYRWNDPTTTMPIKLAEDIVTLCPEGKILRENLCYDYVGVCSNSMSSNMCTNPYDGYCLDIPNATQPGYCNADGGNLTDAEKQCMLDRCNGNINRLCTDRPPKDAICDSVISLTCSDVASCRPGDAPGILTGPPNSICDESDLLFCAVQCTDANQNGICDDVETSGCYCQYTYQPVCWMESTSTTCSLSTDCPTGQLCTNLTGATKYCTKAVTYPNQCFATCAGKTSGITSGECIPKVEQIQCRQASDCYEPCIGITRQCINFMCSYSGECNPRYQQCSVVADCPPSPCTGVTVSCVNNNCQFTGKCLTKPEQPMNIWNLILSIWNSFIQWLKSFLGWA